MKRLWLQRILGVIWLVDGVLQFKPAMLGVGFVRNDVLPLSRQQPAWLHHLIMFEAHLMLLHPILADAGVGMIQIAIGTALLTNRWIRLALAASAIWALSVWVFGEGLGQLLTNTTWLGNGAPGAALLYLLLSVGLWPQWAEYRRIGFFAAAAASVWMAEAVLWLGPAAAGSLGLAGAVFSSAIALGFLIPALRCWAATLGAAAALVAWALGQQFGQFWTPYGTDFNTGILLALLCVGVGLPIPARRLVKAALPGIPTTRTG